MMIGFLSTALLAVSLLTNLSVEGIKKLLEGSPIQCSSNALAAGLSVVIAGILSAWHLFATETTMTVQIGFEIFLLMYLSFLVSTVGYDKVVQMVKQIQNGKAE